MGASQSQPPSAPLSQKLRVSVENSNVRNTVIIPVDSSKQAESAFLWYMKHVHKPENNVEILHCQEAHLNSPMMAEHAFKSESWAEMMEAARKEGKSLTEKYERKLESLSVKGSVHVEVGRAGELVIEASKKYNANMIVMGTRGYGVIRRTVLGSVSEYVLHHAQVPVTVVPPDIQHWFF